MVGLSLVAVFAITAITATSASALPEWGKCEAKAGGNYTDSNCTTKAKPKGNGTFEWKKGSELAPVKFKGQNEGSGGVLYAPLEDCIVGGEADAPRTRQKCQEEGGTHQYEFTGFVECKEESATGEAVGKNAVANVQVTFQGCNLLGSIPCQNGSPEEIKTHVLKGKLGYIKKSAKEAGVLLEPQTKKGGFASFVCPALSFEILVGAGNKTEGAGYVKGTNYPSGCVGECPGATPLEETHGGYNGIISPIKPVNKMTSTYTQEYKVEEPEGLTYNIPRQLEGKHMSELESRISIYTEPGRGSLWAPAGEEITNVNTLQPAGEEGEIKA